MKTKLSFFFAILVAIFLISCEKMEFRKDIKGTWYILHAGGGDSSSESETNFTHLSLKQNNQYSIFNHDTLKASGTFSLYDSGYDDNKYYEPFYVIFKKGSTYDPKLFFPIDEKLDISIFNNDTLAFSGRNITDGIQFFFTRTQ